MTSSPSSIPEAGCCFTAPVRRRFVSGRALQALQDRLALAEGLSSSLAKESSHGAVCWPARMETSLRIVDQTARPCGKASVRRHLSALPLSLPGEHLERPGSALRAGCCRPGTGTRSKALSLPVACLDARHVKAALSFAGQEPRQPPHPDAAAGPCRVVAMHRDVANQIRGTL
jgi:hypothetical protein